MILDRPHNNESRNEPKNNWLVGGYRWTIRCLEVPDSYYRRIQMICSETRMLCNNSEIHASFRIWCYWLCKSSRCYLWSVMWNNSLTWLRLTHKSWIISIVILIKWPKVSMYDQYISQSHPAGQPMAWWERDTEHLQQRHSRKTWS